MDTRDSDLGDDSMSHIDEQSDREDDMRDCESSDEGVNVNVNGNGKRADFSSHSPINRSTDLIMNDTPFPTNHALGMLSNLSVLNMGVQNLQNFQQHNDVLEKIKTQVRDMKVGFMNSDFSALHPSFTSTLQNSLNFSAAQSLQNASSQSHESSNGFPFSTTTATANKDGSNSSTSSETSNSSQPNNGWSFEEQFKQVRQLYEINDDPKRKIFLDDLFQFMQKRGTPINRLPIMAKSVLDLYELYLLVVARGGLVDVINKKLWQEIIKGLHLPSSITSAAFTLRTQYMKYLYPYECEKKNLSSPAELQAAIDGNRREGRRTSYGQFDTQIQQQLQMRSPIPNNLSQMSPLSLVTHASQHQNRLMGAPQVGSVPLFQQDIEKRMMEYFSMMNQPKDMKRSQSPEVSREALHALELSRMALFGMSNMYGHSNAAASPNHHTTSPPEIQREALNLQRESPSPIPPSPSQQQQQHHRVSIKREHDHNDVNDYHSPSAKRGFIRTDMDLGIRKSSSINNNNHHLIKNNNNPHMTPTKLSSDDSTKDHRRRSSQSPSIDSDDHRRHRSPPSHSKQQNGSSIDSFSSMMMNGMQFKIVSKENSSTGEPQLVVKLEVNGIQFEGVLFPNRGSSPAASTTSRTPPTEPMDSPAKNSSPANLADDHKISHQPLVSS